MVPEIHGVSVVIYNPKTKKFLLQERADGKGLVFPGGGFHFSEAPTTAICREIEEEMGVRLPVSEVFGVLIQRKKVDEKFVFGFLHLFFHETEEENLEFNLDPEEVASIARLSLEEVLENKQSMLATKRIAILFKSFTDTKTPVTGKLGEPVGYQGQTI